MTKVSDDIRKYSFYKKILEAGGQVYLVGGCVRDEILKNPIKDLDLVVRLIAIEDLVNLLKMCGYTNLVGKHFGIIKFHPQENPEMEIDIALPRQESSTGIGHKDFDVHFDHNMTLEKDLLRRDFTINAMAKNIETGEIIDPSGGQDDIENRIINTVFENSFVEDPLRLLRAVQFSARFGFAISEKTFAQMKEHAKLIKSVAPERIILEVRKLFMAPKPSLGFNLMRDTGILPYVFPDVQNMIGVMQPKKKNEDVYDHTMKVLDASRSAEELEKPGDIDIMFSALFHDAGKPKTHRKTDEDKVTFFNHQLVSTGIARRWMREYKATTIGVKPKEVCHLVKHHMFETKAFEDNDKAIRRFINKIGKDKIFDLIDLRLADKKGGKFPKKVYGILQLRKKIREEINKKPPFTAKDLALTGFDIMELGFKAGPVIGIIQRYLMEKVLDDPQLNTKEELTKLILENKMDFKSE